MPASRGDGRAVVVANLEHLCLGQRAEALRVTGNAVDDLRDVAHHVALPELILEHRSGQVQEVVARPRRPGALTFRFSATEPTDQLIEVGFRELLHGHRAQFVAQRLQ